MIKEFFGFNDGGYQRTPEGFLSWQHLVFVFAFIILMILLAVVIGIKFRKKDEKTKNKVLIFSAILIDVVELSKIVILSFRCHDAMHWIYELPLFLCSIHFIALPLAAFAKGRVKEAALDFVLVFGILSALMGNIGAGQNFNAYPVLSFDNVVSGITHTISGFASLYIAISGMASMKKKNIWITFVILISFCIVAYVADILIPYNYMFLMRGDGTPYDIFYNLVGGNPVAYPLIVVGLFLLYIGAFYFVWILCTKKRDKTPSTQENK